MSAAIATETESTAAKVFTDQQVIDAVSRLTTIGTLPEVTVKIIQTVENPKSSAGQLNKIVSNDPALVTRILKVVNSSFYGLPGQIASIERAIVLLGLNGVKNLAVAASLGQLFRGVKLCEPFTARDLWTHCLAVAVGSRELAKHLSLPIADEAFLAGMIHDIGLLAQIQLWPEKLREVCQQMSQRDINVPGESFCDCEHRLIGCDHQQLGRALAARWRFPLGCQHAAGSHHHPTERDEQGVLVGLVYVADTICCDIGQGFNLTGRGQKIDDTELEWLHLSRSVLERVTKELPQKVSDTAAVFS
ncbi:MAG TPA: HDOD domain-containing protein [Tepidisphaeraceae bacterium]|nr:HDOD domain-containing protein [Tepidisphaeraceae bacterium]